MDGWRGRGGRDQVGRAARQGCEPERARSAIAGCPHAGRLPAAGRSQPSSPTRPQAGGRPTQPDQQQDDDQGEEQKQGEMFQGKSD